MRQRVALPLLSISAALFCIIYFSAFKADQHHRRFLPGTWQTGDIIFVEGTSVRSSAVRFLEFGHSDYSHVGFVLLQDGIPFVIHADPQRGHVVKDRWDYFLSSDRVNGAAIFRVNGGTDSSVIKAGIVAKQYLDNAVPFDDEFDLSADKKLYCTELVWRAYLSAGIDLRGKLYHADRKYLFPSDLIDAKIIREIVHY